jgi:hypothetical protein
MTMTSLHPKIYHPVVPQYLATLTKTIADETVDSWQTISMIDHLPDCIGQVTTEENMGERIRRWKCSKCSVRGAKGI